MGGTLGNGGLKVATHAHRKPGEPVSCGDRRQMPKVRCAILILRWDAHQTPHRQVKRTASGDEPVRIIRKNSGLLGLSAGIDLDEQVRAGPTILGQACQHGIQRSGELAGLHQAAVQRIEIEWMAAERLGQALKEPLKNLQVRHRDLA